MNKKIRWAYGLQVFNIIVFIVLANLFFLRHETKDLYYEHICEPFRSGWTVLVGEKQEQYEELPQYIKTDHENELILQRKLGIINKNEAIGFFAFQQQISVYLDDELVLEFVPPPGAKSKTPGNGWKFIHFNEKDAGKTLSIKIVQCYGKNKVMLPVLYKGTSSGIILSYLKSKLILTLISLCGVLIGAILLLLWAISGKGLRLSKGLPWLAFFAIFISMWSGIETNIYSFFVNKLLLFSQLSYLCLKMAVAPFLMFVNITFHKGKSRFLKVLVGLSVMEFWISGILQFYGWVDFADTVFMTHGILIAAAIYVIADWLFNMKNEHRYIGAKKSGGLTYFIHGILAAVVCVTSIMDLVGYYITNNPDVARHSRIGYFIYIIMVTASSLLDYMTLASMGKKAAEIKEEASMDVMTKLNNRLEFEKNIDNFKFMPLKTYAIVMCDLNNLKKFNDIYGHDMGDCYIILGSEMISDCFGEFGKIYRIGGDEFCGILENFSEKDFEEKKGIMEDKLQNTKIPDCDFHMEIACGYAQYDSEQDDSLRDTMKRADSGMYEHKKQLKAKGQVTEVR